MIMIIMMMVRLSRTMSIDDAKQSRSGSRLQSQHFQNGICNKKERTNRKKKTTSKQTVMTVGCGSREVTIKVLQIYNLLFFIR